MDDTLLFVDTNKLLDFYRTRGEGISLLDKLLAEKNRLICTCQVEMEFNKNRAKQIKDQSLVRVESQQPEIPALFRDRSEARELLEAYQKYKEMLDKMTKIVTKEKVAFLKNPATDPVLTKCDEIFVHASEFNLTTCHGQFAEIEDLAHRRFRLGYPPRKPGDTHMGDAINWEWIRHCGKQFKRRVFIVSHDGDFGTTIGNDTYINPFLAKEFKQATNGATVELFRSLSKAFCALGIEVTEVEREAEVEAEQSTALSSGIEQLKTAIAFQTTRGEDNPRGLTFTIVSHGDEHAATFQSVLKDVAPRDDEDN